MPRFRRTLKSMFMRFSRPLGLEPEVAAVVTVTGLVALVPAATSCSAVAASRRTVPMQSTGAPPSLAETTGTEGALKAPCSVLDRSERSASERLVQADVVAVLFHEDDGDAEGGGMVQFERD